MKTIRLKLPLYIQVLSWFFLNILLLSIGVYLFIDGDQRLGWDGLLHGRLGAPFDRLVFDVAWRLSEQDRTGWDQVLQQVTTNSQARLGLVNPFGERIAGETFRVPPEVLQKISDLRHEHPPRRARRRSEGDLLRGDPPFQERPLQGPEEVGFGNADGEPPPPRGGVPREIGSRRGFGQKFIVATGSPVQFWVGSGIPLPAREDQEPRPGFLLIEVNSWRAISLIFDLTPLWLLAGAAGFSALFWAPFVIRITRTLAEMNKASTCIAAGQFDVELGTRWGDELDHLAKSINHLAAQLRRFVTGQKRFLGDIAHELCTPLARMEMALGILEQRADERQAEYVQDVREEVRVMSGLVNELLDFSKAGLVEKNRLPKRVNLSQIVHGVMTRESVELATIRLDVPPDLAVLGQPDLVARAFGNVIRNAIRYASFAGPIEVSTEREGDTVILWVRDSGPGVPPEALAKLGEPFFRPELARTREGGGFGLGLAIVKTCLAACGGSIELQLRVPTGLQVGLRLPLAKAEPVV